MENKLPTRKRNRLEHFDYSSGGAYFITICAKERMNLFWAKLPEITAVGEDIILPPDHIELSPYGKIAEQAIQEIPEHYSHIQLRQYVIMPNHIHIILLIAYNSGRMISSPTNQTSVLTAVGQMKRQVSMKIGSSIWQKSFHDHVIRDKDDYQKISEYIYRNPARWKQDCFYTEK